MKPEGHLTVPMAANSGSKMKPNIMRQKMWIPVFMAFGVIQMSGAAQPETNQVPPPPPSQTSPHKFADEAEGRDYDVFQNFEGTITAIDKKAKMITVRCEGRRFLPLKMTPGTKLTKDGQPATFNDAMVGGTVTGVAGMEKGKFDAINLNLKPAAGNDENGSSAPPKN